MQVQFFLYPLKRDEGNALYSASQDFTIKRWKFGQTKSPPTYVKEDIVHEETEYRQNICIDLTNVNAFSFFF